MANKLYDEASVQAIANAIRSKNKTETKYKISQMAQAIEDIPSIIKRKTGNPIELTDAASAPMVKCVTQITGYQSGTGTPSPDNVRPIVAYTEGEIEVRGKNLFNPSNVLNAYVSESGGVYYVANLAAARLIYAKCEPNTKYTISKLAGVRFTAGYTKTLPQNGVEVFGVVNQNTQSKITISAGSEAKYIVAFVFNANADTVTAETMLASCMIEKGETATTYEAYKGVTHTTTYPSAIYRGSEDVVNGEVTSEWIECTFSDLTWTYNANYQNAPVFIAAVPSGITKEDYHTQNIICSHFPTDTRVFSDGTVDYIMARATNGSIFVRYGDVSTVSDFLTALGDAQLSYKLASPTTSSVTTTNLPIKTLAGYSHIESTTGEMVVDYITDAYQNFVDTIETGSF